MARTWIPAVVLGVAACATPAETSAKDRRGASLLAGSSRTTLAEAIGIALRRVPGEALSARVLLENKRALIEVKVFAGGAVFEVEIDGQSGSVLEVDEGDEEDDDSREGAAADPAPTG